MVAVACLAAATLLAASGSVDGSSAAMRTAAIVVLVVTLWVTASLPEFYTAIIFFLLAALLAVAPVEIVFSGFHSSAAWITFSGLVIGLAVRTTGLGDRLARALIGILPASYFGYLAGGAFAGVMLSFFVPSTAGRVAILLPIMLSVADRLGLSEAGRTGIALATTAGTLYASFGVLPSNIPNLVMYGAARNIYGFDVSYTEWLVAVFPVLGLVSMVLVPVLCRLMFRDRARKDGNADVSVEMSGEARHLAFILCIVLALWMTDFIHGVSPGWIALAAAVACMLPGVGSIPPASLFERVNLGPWLYTAGIIGVGAVISSSGLGAIIGDWLFSIVALRPGDDATNFAAITAIGMGLGLVATVPGQPGIVAPLVQDMVAATGWPLSTAVLAQVPAWATALFPYQYPPMIVAIAVAGLRLRDVLLFMLVMTATTWFVVVPLQFAWFETLGLFGG